MRRYLNDVGPERQEKSGIRFTERWDPLGGIERRRLNGAGRRGHPSRAALCVFRRFGRREKKKRRPITSDGASRARSPAQRTAPFLEETRKSKTDGANSFFLRTARGLCVRRNEPCLARFRFVQRETRKIKTKKFLWKFFSQRSFSSLAGFVKEGASRL